MGDMVMILPALKEITRQYPQAQLYAITSIDGKRLLKVVGLEEKNIVIYRGNFFARFFDVLKVKRFIKEGRFDRIVCFETKKRIVSWLPPNASILKDDAIVEHYALKCLKLVNPNLNPLPKENYLFTHAEKAKALTKMLSNLGIKESTILIGFHPTFSGYGKLGRKNDQIHRSWPCNRFAELSVKLVKHAAEKKIDIKIVMDLLPNERELGLRIQEASKNNVILLPLALDFQRYLCLIGRLQVLIVGNTGVMHVAAALGTRLVALFSKLDPNDCGPYMPNSKCVVLRAEDTAMPKLGLASISVDQVFASTLELLS